MQTISIVQMENAFPAYGHVMDQMIVETILMRTGTTAVSTTTILGMIYCYTSALLMVNPLLLHY